MHHSNFPLSCTSLDDQGKLQQLATLAVDSPLWVQIGQKDELAEAELKYIGPLNRGSGVYFGVQLKVNLYNVLLGYVTCACDVLFDLD